MEFFKWLKGRGLDGVKLIVGVKCLGMLEAAGEVYTDAKYQRCVVHFYHNVFSVVPKSKVKLVAKMFKAIHAQESKAASLAKARDVVAALCERKLKEAAKKGEDSVEETLTYTAFPFEHWTRIRTNNAIERLNREIQRRTRVVGYFPGGNRKQRWISGYKTSKEAEIALAEDSAHISEHLGNVQTNEVKAMQIQYLYSTLIGIKGLSKSTVLKIHRMLKLAYGHAVDWK